MTIDVHLLRLLAKVADDNIEGGVCFSLSDDEGFVNYAAAYNSEGVVIASTSRAFLSDEASVDVEVLTSDVNNLLNQISPRASHLPISASPSIVSIAWLTMQAFAVYEPIKRLLSKQLDLTTVGSFIVSDLARIDGASTIEVVGGRLMQRDDDEASDSALCDVGNARYGVYFGSLFKAAIEAMDDIVYIRQEAEFNDLVLDGTFNGEAIRFIIYNLNSSK